VHVVQGLGQSGCEETELRRGGLGVIEEIGGMVEEVVGHAELDGLDVVGDAGERTGAGGVGDEVARVAVGVGTRGGGGGEWLWWRRCRDSRRSRGSHLAAPDSARAHVDTVDVPWPHVDAVHCEPEGPTVGALLLGVLALFVGEKVGADERGVLATEEGLVRAGATAGYDGGGGYAEDALSKADNHRDAIGGYDQTAYLFHVSHVLYEEKDFAGSIKALKQSIRLQPKQERQGRVHAYALLAQRQLRVGHLDAACESWSRFLDEYEHVSSNRGDDHFRAMSAELRRHPAASPVRTLARRARDVAAAKAA
jgi:hypothetical protein